MHFLFLNLLQPNYGDGMMFIEKVLFNLSSSKNAYGKEGNKLNTTYTANRQINRFAYWWSNFLRKITDSTKAHSYEVEKDYSAFNCLTEYEKTVVDRLREEGLSEAEIKRCLAEL